MDGSGPAPWRRYGVALAAIVLATVARFALDPALGDHLPFVTYFVAIMATAWYGGLGPSLVTLILGSLVATYFFVPPRGGLVPYGLPHLVGIGLYFFVGIVSALLCETLRATQRRSEALAEEAMRQREQLQVTLASIGDAVLVTDDQGRVTSLNPVAEALTGWASPEAAGQPLPAVFQILNEETRQEVESPVARVLREGNVVGLANHTVLIARDGTERAIEDSAAPIREAGGEVRGVVLVFRDATGRRETERALRGSEQRFRTLARHAPVGIFLTDDQGDCLFVNQRWCELAGLTPEQAAGQGWVDALHPEDRGRILDEWYASARTGREFVSEYRFRTPQGRVTWLLGDAVALHDDGGRITGYLGTVTDITESRRVADEIGRLNRELHQQVAGFRTLLEVIPIGIAVANDQECRRVWPNPALAQMLGLLPGTNASLSAPAGERPTSFRMYRDGRELSAEEMPLQTAAATGRAVRDLDLDVEVGDGRWLHLLGSAAPLLDEAGRVRGGVSAYLDVTDRRRAEAALKEADRRKDEFLATLAHELRNPLAPIRNALHLMGQHDGRGPEIEGDLAMMQRQVEHLTRLVDDLLDVSRISRGKIELRPEVVELRLAIGHVVEDVRPLLDERGQELTVTLPPGAIRLEADPTRLEQILWNLLSNAVKYTEPGGRIDLMAEREGGQVMIRLRDTGIGIAPEMLPRIFEMFVQVERRSDHARGGLGIGLSLVRSLVEMHGGVITAGSEGPGRGSEFVVRLPVLPNSSVSRVEPKRDDRPPPQEAPPRRRILVTDDNVDAASSLARVLPLGRTASTKLYGQEVRVTHDGPSALEVAGQFHPEVILLDIGMPGMDGYEVARRLRGQPEFEGTLLVALTGWGQEQDRQRSKEAGFNHHLVKPVDPVAIRKLLTKNGKGE